MVVIAVRYGVKGRKNTTKKRKKENIKYNIHQGLESSKI